MGRGECIPQHLHDGLSFDSRSMACPLSLPSSLPFPRLHHLFEPMPHVTLLWSSEIYCVPKLLKFCVSEILCFMVPTWRHSHMPAAVCRFGRLHHENMASYRRRFQVAVALFSVLECVLRAFCMLVSLSVRTLFVSLLSLLFFLRVVTLILSTFLCEICQCVHPVACVLCLRAPCCTPYTLLQTGPCK